MKQTVPWCLPCCSLDSNPVSSTELDEIANPSNPDVSTEEQTGLKLLGMFDFHFLTWSYIFCASLQLMFQANISTFLKSSHLEEYSTLFTTLTFAVGTVAKFFFGFVSDVIVQRVPRVTVSLIAMVLQTIVLTVCVFMADNFTVLMIGTLGVGIPNGATWCLTPTMTSEYFGVKYFGRNWGWMMLGNAIFGLALQKAFGAIYESEIPEVGETDCYGLNCYRWSLVIMAGLSLCSVIFYAGLLERRLAYRKYKQAEISAAYNRIH